MSRNRLGILVEAAVMIALSVVLSNVKILQMPYGGSVTAGSMVPILVIALRHGPRWGVTTGVLCGLIQMMIDPADFKIHPVQVAFDYPLAFGALGLAGFASGLSERASAWVGSLALLGRFLFHVLSGVFFFAHFAPEGQHPLLYSVLYNGAYMIPEIVLSGVLLMILLPALRRALPPTFQPGA